MSFAVHYENRLVCGHRSWKSATRPDPTFYCFPCDNQVDVQSLLVRGKAHPERVSRNAGKYLKDA